MMDLALHMIEQAISVVNLSKIGEKILHGDGSVCMVNQTTSAPECEELKQDYELYVNKSPSHLYHSRES